MKTKVTVATSISNRRTPVSWRSGLEKKAQEDLSARGVPFAYEPFKIKYTRPASAHKYTPDFYLLDNGILVEMKGLLDPKDREKHELIKAQHPGLDIRFVFERSKSPIRKGSKTTYAMWSAKSGFLFADKTVPQEWIDEPNDPARHAAIEAATA